MVMVMATVVDELLENLVYFFSVNKFFAVSIVAIVFSSRAISAEWQVSPSIELKETYSNNVTLASPGNEKSDYISQFNPGISIKSTGPNIQFDAKYIL